MKRHGDLFTKIIEIENLRIAFNKSARGKRWQEAVKNIESNLENSMINIREMLINKTFTTSPYRIKHIFEPKERDIFILPFFPDRIIQHALMNIIEPIWEPLLIRDTYACIKNRGQHRGSQRLMEWITNNSYCLKCDIRKFYPSIDHAIADDIVTRKIKCSDTKWLIRDIIYSVGGGKNAPIGNYTSQWIGNLYMNELDQYLKHVHKVKHYIRYCDDFILLDNDKRKLRELSMVIELFLREKLKLEMSKCELFPTKHGIDFLGYRHFPNGYILLRKSTAKRVVKRINSLNINKFSLEHIRSSIASTFGWLKWCNSHNFQKFLEEKNEKIFRLCR